MLAKIAIQLEKLANLKALELRDVHYQDVLAIERYARKKEEELAEIVK